MRHVFTIHNNFCLTAKTQFGPGAALLLVLTLCLLCLPPPTAQSQSSCVQRLSQVYLIFEDNFLAAGTHQSYLDSGCTVLYRAFILDFDSVYSTGNRAAAIAICNAGNGQVNDAYKYPG